MIVIVGLGNPSRKYQNTRHNMGFMAIDELADMCGIKVKDKRHKALVGTGIVGGQKAILVKPETFMNLSGDSVFQVVRYYQADPENELIVLFDDISLNPGQLRLRRKGSAGGHNGIKNIIERLGTSDFMRVKIGIGEKPAEMDLADYVLGHFSRSEKAIMKDAAKNAADAVISIIEDGIDRAMNKYNS